MNSSASNGNSPSDSDDEDWELREYSSPACSMHEFDLAGERAGEQSNRRVDSAARFIAASPAALYRAHMDPQALISWLPPQGMKGRIDRFEPHVGGTYRMVLTYEQKSHAGQGKTTDQSDVVAGRFVELVPDRLIAQAVEFESDDPAFAGEMKITWTFTAAPGGTHVAVRCENVPSGISAEDHAAGLASSLENLAAYCE